MGACYENYYHEFISCSVQPTADNCIFLKRTIQALDTENVEPWVEVYAVHRGQVYWNGWGNMTVNPRKMKRGYGVEELPKLGAETGYLVRHVDQGRVACYIPEDREATRGQPYPEIVEARKKSLTNYLHLVKWIEGTHV